MQTMQVVRGRTDTPQSIARPHPTWIKKAALTLTALRASTGHKNFVKRRHRFLLALVLTIGKLKTAQMKMETSTISSCTLVI